MSQPRTLIDRGAGPQKLPQRIGYLLQYAVLRPVECLVALPYPAVAGTLAAVARLIGPRLPLGRKARENVRHAFPGMDDAGIERIVRGAFDNFVRAAIEYLYLPKIHAELEKSVEIVGAEHFERLRDDGRPGLLVGAHLANLEMIVLAAGLHGLERTIVYRAFNNARIDRKARQYHERLGIELIAKGHRGGLALARRLREGGHVIIMADQRFGRGVAIPFFGREAMTAPAIAKLALDFDAPLLPVQVERIAGARFRVTAHPPIEPAPTDDRDADIHRLLSEITARIETWIRARPEQWLWMHNRWKR